MITTMDIGRIPAKAAKAAKARVAVFLPEKAKVEAISTMDMARVAAKVERVAKAARVARGTTSDGASPREVIPAIRMCCIMTKKLPVWLRPYG